MQGQQTQKTEAAKPLEVRVRAWVQKVWRPAGTGFVVLMALLLGWAVVNGKHGLSAWQKQRAEHKKLEQEIDELKQRWVLKNVSGGVLVQDNDVRPLSEADLRVVTKREPTAEAMRALLEKNTQAMRRMSDLMRDIIVAQSKMD